MQLNLTVISLNSAFVSFRYTLVLCLLFALCALSLGCSKKSHAYLPTYQFKSDNGQPDYGNLQYWAAHPWKYDPSDSVPKSLLTQSGNDSLADVFFVHPTTFTSKNDSATNATIDDAELNARTDYTTILYQASAFNQNSRVFAPRYRQIHYRLFFSPLQMTTPMDIAYADVKAAFEYYLAHYNQGRPIIIAAHSQGTMHAVRLLKHFFEDKPLQKQLVCAYLIGKPLPTPQVMHTNIPPCSDSTATGCYVSWRTFKKGYQEKMRYSDKIRYEAFNTNPLTWKQDSAFAPRSLNTGGILKNFNKLRPGLTDAQVNGHQLWSSKPKFFGNFLITTKIYHIGDINLFYNNIRQNMATRIKYYLQQNKR